jgi:hypothetical protein
VIPYRIILAPFVPVGKHSQQGSCSIVCMSWTEIISSVSKPNAGHSKGITERTNVKMCSFAGVVTETLITTEKFG